MNMVSDQIQEPEPVAEAEEPEIVACSITDGSQAIAHDGFDVETFEQAADDYARLARTVLFFGPPAFIRGKEGGQSRDSPGILIERRAPDVDIVLAKLNPVKRAIPIVC